MEEGLCISARIKHCSLYARKRITKSIIRYIACNERVDTLGRVGVLLHRAFGVLTHVLGNIHKVRQRYKDGLQQSIRFH